MGLSAATYTGETEIQDFYDAVHEGSDESPCWSLWHSEKDIAAQYTGIDKDRSKKLFEAQLEVLTRAKNTRLMYLKFHPADKGYKYITRKSDALSITPVRVFPIDDMEIISGTEESYQSRPQGIPFQMWDVITGMKNLPAKLEETMTAKLRTFEERLAALESDEVEEAEPDQLGKVVGLITGITQNPQIMGAIGTILGYLKPAPPVMGGYRSMNGMDTEPTNPVVENEPAAPDENLVNDALNRLHLHCKLDQDLPLLADLAEQNPDQFKMLLSMLRKG